MEVPEIIWRYIGIIQSMENSPGLYGMDKQREQAHDELIEYYKITRADSKSVTDRLDKYKYDPVLINDALNALQKPEPKKRREPLPHCWCCGTPKHVIYKRVILSVYARATGMHPETKVYECQVCGERIYIHPKCGRYGRRWG